MKEGSIPSTARARHLRVGKSFETRSTQTGSPQTCAPLVTPSIRASSAWSIRRAASIASAAGTRAPARNSQTFLAASISPPDDCTILSGMSNQPPVLGPDGVARPYIGGQALIEGVMMRSPHSFVAAVRRQDGSLVLREKSMPDLRRGARAWP